MPDTVSRQMRSRMMSGIKGKDTKPELLVRKALHRKGFRFRLHRKDLPGKPDLVFPKYRSVVFVNGCFWHGHGCRFFKWPQTNREFWKDKISNTVDRDNINSVKLQERGWRVFTVWECSLRNRSADDISELLDALAEKIKKADHRKEL